MKTAGIIGGIGPESTIEYYRFIIDAYRRETADGSYPSIIINSIDMKRMLDEIAAGSFDETISFLSNEIDRLVAAGADFAAIASNTPHIVFAELEQRASIPLVSIVEAACRTASTMGLSKVGLMGTKYTMNGGFYQKVFHRVGIEVVVSSEAEQQYIHEKYMQELVNGLLLDKTRARLTEIATQMKERNGIQGVILGGTELPLILRDVHEIGIPYLIQPKYR